MNIWAARSSTEERTRALPQQRTIAEQDQRIADAVRQEQPRLRNFIRTRVADEEVDDILQEVFSELVEAYRLMKPIEEVGAWLFRVARNRIIDRFRTRRPESTPPMTPMRDEEDLARWEDLLPSRDAGPEAAYARRVLMQELDTALDELPAEQREVFLAHEVEGRSFKELAAITGVSVNTLLTRKHAAVVYLRRRLRAIYEEFAKTWGRTL
jgi:RNA polymerase sigma factor (sigma-70 family)